MITILPHADGCLLAVRAQSGARKNCVIGEQSESLKIAVTAPPEDGRANQAIVELLRDWLGLKRSQVDIASGATSRNKRFLIRGMSAEHLQAEIQRRLSEAA